MPTSTQKQSVQIHTTLFATNGSNSVLAELNQSGLNRASYTPYGHHSSEFKSSSDFGFNGEIREPITSWYTLGNGNRVYNPVLMRFHSPDKFSPFDAGGLNAYMYCVGDPINRTDPTGNFPIWKGITVGLLATGAVAGIASTATDGNTKTALAAFSLAATAAGIGYSRFNLYRSKNVKNIFSSISGERKPSYKPLSSKPMNPTTLLKPTTAPPTKPVTAISIAPSDTRAVQTLNSTLGTAADRRPNYWPNLTTPDEAFRLQVREAGIQNRLANTPGAQLGLAARRALRRQANAPLDGVPEAQRIRGANLHLEI